MIISAISEYIIPFIMVSVIMYGLCKRRDVFSIFTSGAKDGMYVTFQILPSLIGLMVAIAMVKECGILQLLTKLLNPFLSFIGLPEEVLPLALLRPVSGSASLGIVNSVLASSGADSYPGRVASVMMGSTETTFYTIALFYGCTKEKSGIKTILVALLGDFCGLLGSVIFCRIFF
ncbi:MAG: spore maturation protein [Clostridia bacterium]|nr:spore maturation protein [Clostridia bacterium]